MTDMKKLLAEMDEKLGEIEISYNTMQHKNEQALKEKDARIAELELCVAGWKGKANGRMKAIKVLKDISLYLDEIEQ